MTKHLKTFTSDNERRTFESSNYYVEPYVSIVRGGGKIDTHYNVVPSIILTMEDSSKIKMYHLIDLSMISLSGIRPDIDVYKIIKIELSNEITGINDLTGCGQLESINIPDSVTRISSSAFNTVSSLSSISIPKSITRIENNTFNSCPSLTSVTLTDSLTYIDEQAFDEYSNIHELKITGKKDISSLLPTNLTNNLTDLYVDASLVETYKTFRDTIGKTFEVSPLT